MALTFLPATQANTGVTAMFPVPGTMFLGMNNGSPALTGADEEVPGSFSYVRQSSTFAAAALGIQLTSNAQNFTNFPADTIPYFSFWTASTGGTYKGGGTLTSSVTVPATATVAAAIGALSVAVQG